MQESLSSSIRLQEPDLNAYQLWEGIVHWKEATGAAMKAAAMAGKETESAQEPS